MDAGLIAAIVFIVFVVALAVYLRREDAKGTWSKEGHGLNEDREPGVRFRPLETPPKRPFD
jgi:hypothetical protein